MRRGGAGGELTGEGLPNDRLGRSVKDVLIIADDLHEHGTGLCVLTGELRHLQPERGRQVLLHHDGCVRREFDLALLLGGAESCRRCSRACCPHSPPASSSSVCRGNGVVSRANGPVGEGISWAARPDGAR